MLDFFDEAFDRRAENEAEARALVEGLEGRSDHDAGVARARALGFFMGDTQRKTPIVAELITWFVANHPGDLICMFPIFGAHDDDELAEALSALWLDHRAERRLDDYGLRSASSFFSVRDWRLSEAILLEGDVKENTISLGRLRAYRATDGGDDAVEHANAAVGYLDELASSDEERSGYAGQLCAEVALIAGNAVLAKRYADRLLENDPSGRPEHHVAHTVLGRVALLHGDTEAALAHLDHAANTRSDYFSSSYGPRLALAKELFARGHHKAVARYLRKRAETWEKPDGPIDAWIAAAEKGEAPSWDDHQDHM